MFYLIFEFNVYLCYLKFTLHCVIHVTDITESGFFSKGCDISVSVSVEFTKGLLGEL